jgi:hypothetical protein
MEAVKMAVHPAVGHLLGADQAGLGLAGTPVGTLEEILAFPLLHQEKFFHPLSGLQHYKGMNTDSF